MFIELMCINQTVIGYELAAPLMLHPHGRMSRLAPHGVQVVGREIHLGDVRLPPEHKLSNDGPSNEIDQ